MSEMDMARRLLGSFVDKSRSSKADASSMSMQMTSIRYGTVTGLNGSMATIELDDTGESITVRTDTPLAVGNRVALIKSGQSVIVYSTDELVDMINKTVVDGDAEYAVGDDAYTAPKSGWSTTMPDVEQGEYLWMRYTTTLKDGTVKTSTPVCLTSAGGLVITSSEVSYAIGTSGTTPPSSGWQSTPPTAKPGQYLWSREVTSYSDGTSMTSYGVSYQGVDGPTGPTGDTGKPGVGIDDSDVTWQKSSSGTTPPTGTWLQSPPALEPGDYLWTRTVWTYTDGSSTTAYSVSKAGDTGPQGIPGPKGDKGEPRYTWIKYADSALGAGMSDNPDGKDYIGIAYNKQSSTESNDPNDYDWSLIRGAAGAQGIPGPKGDNGDPTYTWIKYADDDKGTGISDKPEGKDYIGIAYNKDTPKESWTTTDYAWSLIKGETGVGIDKVRDMYYLSTSETQVTGGTWVYDECPEWQEGRYIWTRMEITYDDESVHLTDPVLMSALNQANENAAKVTWYVSSDDDGLHISAVKNNPNSGFNVLLTGTSMQFRNGTTVVGEYTGASISFLGSDLYSTNVFRITRDINGVTYFGGDDIYMCFGDIEGTTASQRSLSIQDIIVRTKYANAQITRACSASKTLTSSDSAVNIATTVGAYQGAGLFYTGSQYIRVQNPFYSNGGSIVVEVSASATAGQMSSGKNLALSIYQGTSSSFSAADSVATAITSSANIMTAAAITPVTIQITTSYAYFFLAARSTGGGGVLDPYSTQPAYCPKLTVRIVHVTYESM